MSLLFIGFDVPQHPLHRQMWKTRWQQEFYGTLTIAVSDNTT